MKKILGKIHENIIFIIFLLVIFCGFSIYLSRATANVPHMDYWLYMNSLVEKMFHGGVTVDDLWTGNGVHRSPLQLFIFLCNVRLFGYNAQIEVALGAVFSLLVALLVYREYKNNWMANFSNEKKLLFFVSLFGVLVAMFSLNQWEMITTEFYFSLEIRIISFWVSFIITNQLLKNKEKYGKYAIEIAIVYVFVICICAGAYFGACMLSIIFAIIFDFCLEKEKKKYMGTYFTLLAGLFVGTIIYMYNLNLGVSTGGLTIDFDFVKDFLSGFVLLQGASVFGFANFSLKQMFVMGLIICFIHLLCVVTYFYNKMYKVSYIPMLLGAYVVCFYMQIFISRGMQFDLTYLTSSRYVCDTLWFSVADIWILTAILQQCKVNNVVLKMQSIKQAFLTLCLLSIIFFNVYSNCLEWKRAPYIKNYYNSVISLIERIDTLTEDEFSIFGYDSEIIKNDVRIMKKYHLGTFKYYDGE